MNESLSEINFQSELTNAEAPNPPVEKSQPAPNVQPHVFENIPGRGEEGSRANFDILMDVALQVTVELGRTRRTVRDVLDLQHGSVIELDRAAGEAVDIYVNNHILARGEVVVVDDKFGVRITEVLTPKRKNGDS